MKQLPRCPQRPTSSDAPIGIDRARLYVGWIREHAAPVLAEAESLMQARYPSATPDRSSVRLRELATWKMSPDLTALCVGVVSASVMSGSFAMVDINITRDGELIARPSLNMSLIDPAPDRSKTYPQPTGASSCGSKWPHVLNNCHNPGNDETVHSQ